MVSGISFLMIRYWIFLYQKQMLEIRSLGEIEVNIIFHPLVSKQKNYLIHIESVHVIGNFC